MEDWMNLPLFPLNTVLFPGMMLPLHVFEERYRLMIDRCLEHQRPFGVVLIREGKEAGGPALTHDVGTTALIAAVSKLDDGRYNLVTVGSERFRLRGVRTNEPYLIGDAEPWPMAGGEQAEIEWQARPLRAELKQYLDRLHKAAGHQIHIEPIPEEPGALAVLVAVALQVPLSQKQDLLCQPSIGQLIRTERRLLRREELILDYVIRSQGKQWEGGYSGYLANN